MATNIDDLVSNMLRRYLNGLRHPSQYKFNDAEDYNDAGVFRKAIFAMKIDQPATFGVEHIFGANCSGTF